MYQPSILAPRALILYYSLSGQSRALVNLLAAGMRSQGTSVVLEPIKTLKPVGFPFGSIHRTLWMMIITFFRARLPVAEPSSQCSADYDLIILAGPTWSYNPSGPVLFLLDHYGERIFNDKLVRPLISCRGYYRLHDFVLRRMLRRFTDRIEPSLIFCHPVPEPWSSLGVFIKSIGLRPDKIAILSKHYHRYGHTKQQLFEARQQGTIIGQELAAAGIAKQNKKRSLTDT